jgi:hypothetical protein
MILRARDRNPRSGMKHWLMKIYRLMRRLGRDLAGFDAALNHDSGALKSGFEVQLGTGEGGSGVGIKQKQGGTTSAAGNTTNVG